MKRDFKGIWIPANIWLSKGITTMEKLFFVEIDSLDNENGCFASNEYFAEFFEISTRRASEVINSLVQKGFITSEIDKANGNRRVLHALALKKSSIPMEEKFHRVRKKSSIPMEEKFQHNNTFNNTINIDSLSEKKFSKKVKTANDEKKPPQVAPAPPTLEEVKQYFSGKIKADSKTPERFFNTMELSEWQYKGKEIKNWKLLADNWVLSEKKEVEAKPRQTTYNSGATNQFKNIGIQNYGDYGF